MSESSGGGQMQTTVFINPMKLFEWERDPIPQLPRDPTPERLLQYLCTPGIDSELSAFKARYREISAHDQSTVITPHEPAILENLIWSLRHAKTSYLTGNYIGSPFAASSRKNGDLRSCRPHGR